LLPALLSANRFELVGLKVKAPELLYLEMKYFPLSLIVAGGS